jgi:signal transduction histidine kinase
VELEQKNGVFQMRVSDNGKGFDPISKTHPTGRGMVNMAERARAIGGHLWIESARGGGTALTVELPLSEEKGT